MQVPELVESSNLARPSGIEFSFLKAIGMGFSSLTFRKADLMVNPGVGNQIQNPEKLAKKARQRCQTCSKACDLKQAAQLNARVQGLGGFVTHLSDFLSSCSKSTNLL